MLAHDLLDTSHRIRTRERLHFNNEQSIVYPLGQERWKPFPLMFPSKPNPSKCHAWRCTGDTDLKADSVRQFSRSNELVEVSISLPSLPQCSAGKPELPALIVMRPSSFVDTYKYVDL